MIEMNLFGGKITSLDLRNLTELSLEIDKAGNGTIYFANRSAARAFNAFGGASMPGTPSVPSFELGTNAKTVYETVRTAQRDAR